MSLFTDAVEVVFVVVVKIVDSRLDIWIANAVDFEA